MLSRNGSVIEVSRLVRVISIIRVSYARGIQHYHTYESIYVVRPEANTSLRLSLFRPHKPGFNSQFLVDRTNGRACGTMSCPSVCRLSSVLYVLWLNGTSEGLGDGTVG